MKTSYTEAFKEQAIEKALQRGGRSLISVANELNMNHWTLKNWLKKMPGKNAKNKSHQLKRPKDWTLEERLQVLMESHGLEEEALHAYCREKGLFPHHLGQWRQAFSRGQASQDARSTQVEMKALKDGNKQLQRELRRKEKALAEAAALLVLQKKFQAFWKEKGE